MDQEHLYSLQVFKLNLCYFISFVLKSMKSSLGRAASLLSSMSIRNGLQIHLPLENCLSRSSILRHSGHYNFLTSEKSRKLLLCHSQYQPVETFASVMESLKLPLSKLFFQLCRLGQKSLSCFIVFFCFRQN